MNAHADEPPLYSAKVCRDLTGLSFRQINDWDAHGVLPHTRAARRGWRRFAPNELLVLMICVEFRTQFGASLHRLSVLGSLLLGSPDDPLAATFGVAARSSKVWLVTDFDAVAAFVNEKAAIRELSRPDPSSRALGFCSLLPLASRLCRHVGPTDLDAHGYPKSLVSRVANIAD